MQFKNSILFVQDFQLQFIPKTLCEEEENNYMDIIDAQINQCEWLINAYIE